MDFSVYPTKLKEYLSQSFTDDTQSSLLQLCKDMYINITKTPSAFFELSLDEPLHQLIIRPDTDRLVLEMACKVYFFLQVKRNNKIELASLIEAQCNNLRLSNYIVRGILSTNYDFINPDLLYDMIIAAVQQCLRDNSHYIGIALNNLQLFCKNYKNYPFNFAEMWNQIVLCVPSPITGVRDEALHVLEFIVKYSRNTALGIARLVLDEWAWTNGNKFYVLAVIVEGLNGTNNVLGDLNISERDLVDGLIGSLKQRNLYSPGQSLLRALLKRDCFTLAIDLSRRIFATTYYDMIHNFIIQWLNTIKDKEFIFEDIKECQSVDIDSDLNHYILFRSAFKDQMVTDNRLIDINLTNAAKLNDLSAITKQHLFDIIMHRCSKETDLQNDLPYLVQYLEHLAVEEETSLRQHVIKNMTILVNHLIRSYFGGPKENQETIVLCFKEMCSKVISSGFESPREYSRIILAIKLLGVLMQTFYSSKKVCKATNLDENKSFLKILNRKDAFDGTGDKYFIKLVDSSTNEFDDVRQLAITLLVQFFPISSARLNVINEKFCETMYFGSIEDCSRIHSQFQIIVTTYKRMKLDLSKMQLEYMQLLREHFEVFSLDPLKAIQTGTYVFERVNLLNEFAASGQLTEESHMDTIKTIMEINDRMLELLSLSNDTTDKDFNPSFEAMDESLQIIINNNNAGAKDWNLTLDMAVMQQQGHVKNRKALLLAIWMTMKACGEIAATIVEQSSSFKNREEVFSIALRINTSILCRCRHKGAIEAGGLSFGRIVSASVTSPDCYVQLNKCFEPLFNEISRASYCRRGAGFSIMFLQLLKNDKKPGRPLMTKALKLIFQKLSQVDAPPSSIQGVFLHYLSVLVRDSSVGQDVLPHMNEIMAMCLEKIESNDWSTRNAALQLFGALVPKIVGQQQQQSAEWEPCQLSIGELQVTMHKIFTFITYCLRNCDKISDILLVAILSFMTAIEYRQLRLDGPTSPTAPPLQHGDDDAVLERVREDFYQLLSHRMEKVRALAAVCFARVHRLKDIPALIDALSEYVYAIDDPNFQHGILLAMTKLCEKLKCEAPGEWEREYRESVQSCLFTKPIVAGLGATMSDYIQIYRQRLMDVVAAGARD